MGFFSRPDGEWLARRFGPKIEIHIGDDEVRFRSGDREISLAPRLYLQGTRIVGFGARPTQEQVEELDVFSASVEGVRPRDLLSKLISHGIV